MTISQLGYLVIEATDIERWRIFATQVIGMASKDGPDGELYLKIDGRAFRFLIVPGESDRLVASGWELSTQGDFDALRSRLETAGVAVEAASDAERVQRHVTGLVRLSDPSGNGIELYWGPISDFTRFVSPVGVKTFVTGPMGMGHVVLPTTDFDATCQFWETHLGMALSDILRIPGVPTADGGNARVHFYHCNPRQHSLALGEIADPSGCFHMMVEVPDMDEVGLAMDRVAAHQVPLASTLGRHVNDDMISFYIWTPGGFQIEFGCGGLVKNWAEEGNVFETTRGSHWGHQWLPRPAEQA